MATTVVALPQSNTPRKKSPVGRIVIYALLIAATLFYLMPVYVMVVNGLKDKSYMTLPDMWKLPLYLNGGGFPLAWETISPNLWASLRMVIPATIGSSLLGAVNGYLLSKWKFRGSDVIFTVILFGMFIPYQAILIPLIQTLDWIGIYGSWQGLVLVHVVYGIPITSLIFRNYFTNVPTELVEAARIDGAGLIQTFFQIMLPLSLPAFVVVGIFQFTNIWNDFLFGVTVVFRPDDQPVTVALNNLNGTQSVDWTVVMAAAVLSALPTALVYIFLGRFFIRGLLAGSMKG
ncbi:MAG: putative transporter permease protein [Thermomicrobiales bacterium]|jgi:glucose/mannose transport system permease protein|nr:putative transporter permease protein [Thermomicrobiales bacterium]MCD6058295.1 putative transporter permease protein [Thermomicrobiales bacterium]MDF2758481.1 putative transporter permease protein [Thermomicrobiales bacterium]